MRRSIPSVRNRLPSSGFSLVELAVSVALLAAVLLAALRSNLASGNLSATSEETQTAVRVLNNARAMVIDSGAENLILGLDPGGAETPLPLASSLQDQVVGYTLPDWTPGDPTPDVLGLRITLDWTSRSGRARSLSILEAVR